ncbi:MAG: hypothetical protein HY821_11615, partial [Acidobacteria bacterium]|nr:hypothetical protein [Acidobacteriota bacterium]
MLRRDFLTLPAVAPLIAAPRPSRRVAVLRLHSAAPLSEADRIWSRALWPAPLKIDVRPHPGWWPTSRELPDRWSAWLEMPGGWSVLLIAQPAGAHPGARRP